MCFRKKTLPVYDFLFTSDILLTSKAFSNRSIYSSLQHREQIKHDKVFVSCYIDEVAC